MSSEESTQIQRQFLDKLVDDSILEKINKVEQESRNQYERIAKFKADIQELTNLGTALQTKLNQTPKKIPDLDLSEVHPTQTSIKGSDFPVATNQIISEFIRNKNQGVKSIKDREIQKNHQNKELKFGKIQNFQKEETRKITDVKKNNFGGSIQTINTIHKIESGSKPISKGAINYFPMPEMPNEDRYKELKDLIDYFRRFETNECEELKIFKIMPEEAKLVINQIAKVINEKENPSSLKKMIANAIGFICSLNYKRIGEKVKKNIKDLKENISSIQPRDLPDIIHKLYLWIIKFAALISEDEKKNEVIHDKEEEKTQESKISLEEINKILSLDYESLKLEVGNIPGKIAFPNQKSAFLSILHEILTVLFDNKAKPIWSDPKMWYKSINTLVPSVISQEKGSKLRRLITKKDFTLDQAKKGPIWHLIMFQFILKFFGQIENIQNESSQKPKAISQSTQPQKDYLSLEAIQKQIMNLKENQFNVSVKLNLVPDHITELIQGFYMIFHQQRPKDLKKESSKFVASKTDVQKKVSNLSQIIISSSVRDQIIESIKKVEASIPELKKSQLYFLIYKFVSTFVQDESRIIKKKEGIQIEEIKPEEVILEHDKEIRINKEENIGSLLEEIKKAVVLDNADQESQLNKESQENKGSQQESDIREQDFSAKSIENKLDNNHPENSYKIDESDLDPNQFSVDATSQKDEINADMYLQLKTELENIILESIDIEQNDIQNLSVIIQNKINEIENCINKAAQQNEELKKSFPNPSEVPPKKQYEIKESTKGFVQMVEPGWVSELLNKEPKPIIIDILKMLFVVFGFEDIPKDDVTEQFWIYTNQKLRKRESDIGKIFPLNSNLILVSFLLELEKHVEMNTEQKIRLQKLIESRVDIINPSNYDGVDGLCGVISFLMKEISEYLGIIPLDNVKKVSLKEKIFLFNCEKIDYWRAKISKLNDITIKYGGLG